MKDIVSVAVAAAAVIVLFLVARSARARLRPASRAAAPVGPAAAQGGPAASAGDQLVAVIAAAVSAASGMAPGSFRIVDLAPIGAAVAQRGFNTPVWGHIDRLYRGE
jgi:hypothetical protein